MNLFAGVLDSISQELLKLDRALDKHNDAINSWNERIKPKLLEFFKGTVLSGFDSATFGGSLAVSILTGLVFVVILMSAGYVLGIEEIKALWWGILEKIKKYAGK